MSGWWNKWWNKWTIPMFLASAVMGGLGILFYCSGQLVGASVAGILSGIYFSFFLAVASDEDEA